MSPTFLRVPVGTTVTFMNPGPATFPNFPEHEDPLRDPVLRGPVQSKLNPGQSVPVHVRSGGRILRRRLHRSAPDRQGRGVSTSGKHCGRVEIKASSSTWARQWRVFTNVQGLVTAHVQGPGRLHARRQRELDDTAVDDAFPAVTANVTADGEDADRDVRQGADRQQHSRRRCRPAHRDRQLHERRCAEAADGDGACKGRQVSISTRLTIA